MDRHTALPPHRLNGDISIAQASPWSDQPVTVNSPALEVMTDLTKVKAATTTPDQTLWQAEQAMVYLGVRMLFVVSEMPKLLGLITSTDLHGQRQMQLVHERQVKFGEIRVGDLMTPLSALDAIAFERLAVASVGDVIAALKQAGRNHLLVHETAAGGAPSRVRGIVSRTQIERQLGAPIAVADLATSFSEIARALV